MPSNAIFGGLWRLLLSSWPGVIHMSSTALTLPHCNAYNQKYIRRLAMNALFVALGIMVLALLALLLWFVPHLLQQQATRVASETSQLREMLLDLLNEQEAVTLRQTQLGGSLTQLRDQLELIAKEGIPASSAHMVPVQVDLHQVEDRIGELQTQVQEWARRAGIASDRNSQDNESWAYLLSLLAAIQDRVGTLSQ